jgi:LysM domain
MTAGGTGGAGRLALWSSFLALSLRLLHGAAFGRLSIPLGSLDELAAWVDHTAPTVMAMAVVRLAALVAVWYLTVATVLAVVADIAGWRRFAAVVAALSPALVRRLASRTAGVGLAAGALLAVTPMPPRLISAPASASTSTAADRSKPPSASPTLVPPSQPDGVAAPASASTSASAAADPSNSPPAATASASTSASAAADPSNPPPAATAPGSPIAGGQVVEPANQPPAATATAPLDQASPTATMTRLPAPASGSGTTATMTRVGPSDGPHHPPARAAAPAADDDEPTEPWTVAPGDSFWSIAEEVLTDVASREPNEQAVRRYWLQLIEANRRRLPDPANPDLLFPGQHLDIPNPT